MKALARTADLRVMVLGPLNAIKKITEISSDWECSARTAWAACRRTRSTTIPVSV